MNIDSGGLIRPEVNETDAEQIARDLYGIDAAASELGSNQDRNFLLTERSGLRSVLRIDNEVFDDAARDAQHAAIDAYHQAGVTVAGVLPGLDGALTQRWRGLAVRRSEFAAGESMVDRGYLAPVVLEEFGALAASSVNALASLEHPGLDRAHMWDMRVACAETERLAPAISDATLRERVRQATRDAEAALAPVRAALPVQAIHGDLTDDNVMGRRGEDARVHPHVLLDFGDLSYGWRVAELAVTVSSMLHHEADRPLRTLEAVTAFHRTAPLTAPEARALWPLVVARAALLVASGWRQLDIDGTNDYARERIAGEQAIFDAATRYPLVEMTEHVLASLGFQGVADGAGLRLVAVPAPRWTASSPQKSITDSPPGSVVGLEGDPLKRVFPELDGRVVVLDPGVESESLGSGKWLSKFTEKRLVDRALLKAQAAVLPYGVYRLTRTTIDSESAAETWPIDTEIWLRARGEMQVHAPSDATVVRIDTDSVALGLADGWELLFVGMSPAVKQGESVSAGAIIGALTASETKQVFTVGLRRGDAPEITRSHEGATLIAPERAPAWRRFALDPAGFLGLRSLAQRDESVDELLRRERAFASAQERYYDRPMQVERGWRHHLVDTTGRSYVDMVNNVSALGHGHPGIADAVNRQIRTLNTNSRFLYRDLAEYSERLLALLPPHSGLDTVLLVNSGSESVDLALRLAQAATGRQTIVALREAYHGWTMASDAVTTSAFDNPHALESRPEWVHVADVPNRFRGTYRGDARDTSVAQRYAADLGADLEQLAAEGREVAGFICESVLGNAGGVLLPDGYLANVYDRVRAAGGLCIADEVQVGFGRMGSSFWGFEQAGVIPDIITIAKPMGNGFPIGGVITSRRIADALASEGQFFASTGGSPLSCRVGIAVLDALEEEGLQENARIVGSRLAAGFRALAERHAIIGPIHGGGLYLGVELIRDRETLEPAATEAAAICERLRELGVIMLTTSERSNVLKVKPPLCLTVESADFVVRQLDRVLTEGW